MISIIGNKKNVVESTRDIEGAEAALPSCAPLGNYRCAECWDTQVEATYFRTQSTFFSIFREHIRSKQHWRSGLEIHTLFRITLGTEKDNWHYFHFWLVQFYIFWLGNDRSCHLALLSLCSQVVLICPSLVLVIILKNQVVSEFNQSRTRVTLSWQWPVDGCPERGLSIISFRPSLNIYNHHETCEDEWAVSVGLLD